MAGEHTAFFYGTLMVPDILYRVIWGTPNPAAANKALLTIRPALLHSYKRHRVRNADFPAILPLSAAEAEKLPEGGGGDDGVRGTVVTGLTGANMGRLDSFEGSMYERRHVQVAVLDDKGQDTGATVAGETYVWVLSRGDLELGEWDFDDFMEEKAIYWIGVDREDYDDADAQSDDEGIVAPPPNSDAKAPIPKKDSEATEEDEPLRSAV